MTLNEMNVKIQHHERYSDFLVDLADRKYPLPGTPEAEDCELNDQFSLYWSRIADGENLQPDDYVL